MFAIIPLLCFVFISLVFYIKSNEEDILPCWRSSILSASIVWGILLIGITEILNFFNLIAFAWLVGLWGLASVASAYICFSLINNRAKSIVWFKISKISHSEIILLFGIAFIVLTVGLIALLAPPNTWDSMTYHMSRVVHWIQNHNVNHYPTHIMRQLTFTPGAEFVIMHFQILSGGDRFANLAQWFSMLGSIIGVSLIAQQLGADKREQIFSAVVCTTIPMGILQGSSTQTDYVVTFWMVCFIYYILLILKKGIKYSLLLKVGASLGLAMLTKGTSYIYAFPFLVWLVFSCLKKLRWSVWKPILIIVIIVLLINFGYYIRNFDLYGHSLTLPSSEIFTDAIITAPLFISNIVRNISLHVSTPYKFVNNVAYGVIKLIHTLLGVAINDPRITCHGNFGIHFSFHEDSTGNFLHLVLIVVSIIIFFVAKQRKKQRDLIYYLAFAVSAFFIFCFFIKWNPWNSRYHLPFFVLFSPVIAIVLSRISNHRITNFIGVFLILSSFPWVFFNDSRPLIKNFRASKIENIFNTRRIDQYFRNWRGFKNPYMEAVQFIKSKGCSDVGIILDEDDWEYPFFVLLQKNNTQVFRIEHVNVNNISAMKYSIYPFNDFNPCAIISIKSGHEDKIVNKDTVYVKEWSSGPVVRPGTVVRSRPVRVFIKR